MPRTNVVGTAAPPGSGAQRCAQAGEREHRIDSTARTAMATARSSRLLSAYDGDPRGNRQDYLLAELRCAGLRARLWAADIDAVGMALKAGLIEPEQAVELLHDCRALHLVAPNRESAT
jgi:hypothetical protein